MLSRILRGVAVVVLLAFLSLTVAAQDAGPMVKLLKSGRLPPERLPTVLNLVCQRGNAEDLAFVYEQTVKPDGFPATARRQALEGLVAAAQTRKLIPQVTTDGLARLLADPDPITRRAAVQLAAAWKVSALAPQLATSIFTDESGDDSRAATLAALIAIGGEPLAETTKKLLASDKPRLRALGITALAAVDLDRAAQAAAQALADPASASDVDLLAGPFLDRQGGSQKLAAALTAAIIPPDSAKLALRHIYLAGRSDAELVAALSKAAGLDADKPPPTADELRILAAEVLAKGDAARGEKTFRRGDLGCLKCHAISGAGGDVGPELSPLGTTSPVDYVITSILHPDLSIKENFITRNFVTSTGMIHQGIVVDRDDKRVIIKDATGQKITIPVADIDEEAEGRSLMPKGLATFLTQPEFYDLVRFVGELGKPGPYALRSQPTVQKWRYLLATPPTAAEQLPGSVPLPPELSSNDPAAWGTAYARVDGTLPLDEIVSEERKVMILRGEIEVTQPGEVEIKLDSPDGIDTWLDEQPLAGERRATVSAGLHKITLRVDTRKRESQTLRAVVDKPAGSAAEYTVVGGR